MQKSFYASGFLYNLKTQQILLVQSNDSDSQSFWSLLGGENLETEEEATQTFQRLIKEQLNIELKQKQICPIYDYFHEGLGRDNFIFYAEVSKARSFEPSGNINFAWIPLDQISKLKFSPRTKQDVVVGERVIALKERELHPVAPIIRS